MDKNERIKKNNLYYDMFFENVKSRTENRDYSYLINRFINELPTSGVILDIGCGTGEHIKQFNFLGFKTLGIEPSVKSREYCLSQNLNVIEGSFETLTDDIISCHQKVCGVWCAASLLHVPIGQFEEVIRNIYGILEKDGKLFFTLRLGTDHKWDKYDDQNADAERFIQLYEESFLDEIMVKAGFRATLKLIEDSYWGRPTKWISMILKK